jgi:hypothetical protein
VFARLPSAKPLTPIFQAALTATTWHEREAQLSKAYSLIAQMHNALGITAPLPTEVSRFHGRPYLVIHSGRFVDAIHAALQDDEVKRLPPYLGSIDQLVDNTDVLFAVRARSNFLSFIAWLRSRYPRLPVS